MNKNIIDSFPFKLLNVDDKVTFNIGYIFVLGNHWFKENLSKQSNRNPAPCRKISPINMFESFPKGGSFYLNMFSDATGIYKCLISKEKEGDESILIWANGTQFLSQNVIDNRPVRLGTGHCILTKIENGKGTYKILQNYVYGYGNKPVFVAEKEIQLPINLEIKKPKIQYVIYYKITIKPAWKPYPKLKLERDGFVALKRQRLWEQKNDEILANGGNYEDLIKFEDSPIPSIDYPWGHQVLDEEETTSEFSIEFKKVKDDQEKLLSEAERKKWEEVEVGDKVVLAATQKIAYIYDDGKIELVSSGLEYGEGSTNSGFNGNGGDINPYYPREDWDAPFSPNQNIGGGGLL